MAACLILLNIRLITCHLMEMKAIVYPFHERNKYCLRRFCFVSSRHIHQMYVVSNLLCVFGWIEPKKQVKGLN